MFSHIVFPLFEVWMVLSVIPQWFKVTGEWVPPEVYLTRITPNIYIIAEDWNVHSFAYSLAVFLGGNSQNNSIVNFISNICPFHTKSVVTEVYYSDVELPFLRLWGKQVALFY